MVLVAKLGARLGRDRIAAHRVSNRVFFQEKCVINISEFESYGRMLALSNRTGVGCHPTITCGALSVMFRI